MSNDIDNKLEVIQPGELLKAEREKRGITTKQIADILNLPERFIVYLESGDFSKLPGCTFTRGYIRNYAKYFGLENVEELVALFDNTVGGEKSDSRVLDFKQIKRMKTISNSIYWLISFVICIILAGVAFLIWQHYSNSSAEQILSTDNKVISVEPTSTTSTSVDTQSSVPLTANDAVSIPLPINAAPNVVTNTPLLPNETENTTETGSMDTKEQTTGETDVKEKAKQDIKKGEGVIEASFKANCWVNITDATGKVLISKLFVANTSLSITGKAPLEVVLGAPNAVTMSYNGEPVKINQSSNSTHRIKLGK